MPLSWPISAAAGPSTCSWSASRRTSRKSLAFPSARSVTTSHCSEPQTKNTCTRLGPGNKWWPGAMRDVHTGGDIVCRASHGDDHRGSYRRAVGWLLTQQQDHVDHKREEAHELRRWVVLKMSEQESTDALFFFILIVYKTSSSYHYFKTLLLYLKLKLCKCSLCFIISLTSFNKDTQWSFVCVWVFVCLCVCVTV